MASPKIVAGVVRFAASEASGSGFVSRVIVRRGC